MECIEAKALKSSFLSQMAMKTNAQMFYSDDVWCLTGINNAGPEDFPVEELLNLDFSENDFQEGCFSQEDEVSLKKSSFSSSSSTFSGADDFGSLSTGELAVPEEDLENLEWLSQFVDDSTSELSLLCPAGSFMVKTGAKSANKAEPVKEKIRVPCFSLPIPSKARTKRPKSTSRPWSMASPPLSSADSASTTSSSYSSSTLSPFVFMNPVQDTEWLSRVEKSPAKKQKRKADSESGSVSGRRCTHCQVQKTPQWRTGPLGPKTLCNACGVRFKSGRLYNEYRPACSPTFLKEMHSNSHRKVLEMRRQKELSGLVDPSLSRVV